MLVLITYDVNTQTAAGRKRLRKVAKECTNYGQRVQNSVFECQMDATKCRQVKDILEKIIDKEVDSLRFYYLGNNYKNKVEHIGAHPGFDVTETLILWESVCRDDRKHAVVCKADTETHQSKSCDKVYCVQRQCVWQCLKPCVVDVEHFTETDSDYEGKKVARAEGTFQDHQCDDKQCLENIVPCSKCEEWKSCAENKRYRGDR